MDARAGDHPWSVAREPPVTTHHAKKAPPDRMNGRRASVLGRSATTDPARAASRDQMKETIVQMATVVSVRGTSGPLVSPAQ